MKVVEPVLNTKNPGDSVILIAKALDESIAGSFPWETYEECLESVTGDLWDSLSNDGYACSKEESPMVISFVDFSCTALAAEKVGIKGDHGAFPITLIPVDNVRLANSSTQSSPFAIKTVADTVLKDKDSFIEINPETARKLKLDQGDYAKISTPDGNAKVKVHLSEGIMPGVAGMAAGLGHTGDNKYVAGKGVNVNELIGPVEDAGSGLDAAFGIRAKISRV